jgi:hypothetical protein
MSGDMALSSSQMVVPSRSRTVKQNENAGQSHWPGPGIFVRVEVGVSFSPARSRHMSFGYASRNMEERNRNQRHPDSIVPPSGNLGAGQPQHQIENEERARTTRRRRMRSRSALQLRTSPVSAEEVTLSPEPYDQRDYHPFHPEPAFHPEHCPAQPSQSTYRPSPVSLRTFSPQHANSYPPPQTPQASSSQMPPFAAAVRQSTIDRKPLPPLPSRFRLGSDALPWASPTIIDPDDMTYSEPSNLSIDEPSEPTQPARVDDPQRTRELEQLHQAMMGVDSMELGNDWWEPGGSWDRQADLGGLPSGPRGVGWAIAVPAREEDRPSRPQDEQRASYQTSGHLSPPPAYSQGQWGWDWEWEERYGYWVRGLRRSSSARGRYA